MSWMQFAETNYEFGDTHPGKIKIGDVAASLANINRFTGHAGTYSVAQHSVFVSELCDIDTDTALYALMHDAHEAVVNDLSNPLKTFLKIEYNEAYEGLMAVEDAADEAMHHLAGLQWPVPLDIQFLIKKADWIAVATEKRDLMPKGDRDWDMLPHPPHHREIKDRWSASTAAQKFLERFRTLCRKRAK